MVNNYYLRVDEKTNTLDSLQKTRVFLSSADKDDFYWKWSMIALHNVLYGSMILALKGTNPERVGGKNKRLISFGEALKRIQNPKYMGMYISSKFVCINPEIDKLKGVEKYRTKATIFPPELSVDLEHLNKYIRNEFMHYYPKSISFGKRGFIEIIYNSSDLIKFLLLESGNVILNDGDRRLIKDELNLLQILTTNLKIKYKYE